MGSEQIDIRLPKRQLLWEYHSVDDPRLSEYRKMFGQRSSPGGIVRKANVP